MTQLTMAPPHKGFGETQRRDLWWAGPLATLIGLLIFIIYANIATFQGTHFEIRESAPGQVDWADGYVAAPYLTPFYSPLLFDDKSPHAIWHTSTGKPQWWPSWLGFSAALLILPFPLLFRLTCYYYRKAYYRAFWADPPACGVGEPRKSYLGENHLPLIFQNIHRYTLYFALIFIVILTYDVVIAFIWPTDRAGNYLNGAHQFGMGLGTLIMLINILLISGFTFGCNSLRHLTGGRLNCFSCPHNLAEVSGGYKTWRAVSWFNERHMLWAWLSLFSVGFTDLYIRLCSYGIWKDVRFF